jgi:hypothetical protein
MLKYVEPLDWLPTAEDLLDSDETPVDNELQELVPTLVCSEVGNPSHPRSRIPFCSLGA